MPVFILSNYHASGSKLFETVSVRISTYTIVVIVTAMMISTMTVPPPQTYQVLYRLPRLPLDYALDPR